MCEDPKSIAGAGRHILTSAETVVAEGLGEWHQLDSYVVVDRRKSEKVATCQRSRVTVGTGITEEQDSDKKNRPYW